MILLKAPSVLEIILLSVMAIGVIIYGIILFTKKKKKKDNDEEE